MSTTALTTHPHGIPTGADDIAAWTVAATKVYGTFGRDNAVVALDHLSASFRRGHFTAIMGPSGSGKSTLLHCLAGLDTLTSGQAFVGGQDLSGMSDRELTQLRRDRIGFIFQAYNLVPTLTALENIVLPSSLAGRKADQAWLDQVVKAVSLGDRLRHRPNELSGGQQQRVACARALVGRPDIVFADEPSGNLDSRSSAELLSFLRRAVKELGQTIVMVTHDPSAAAYADRVVFLADGKLVGELEDPTAESVLAAWPGWVPEMLKATISSLVARKLRLGLTAFAVVIGVAFMSGSFVLSDTLTNTFNTLFQEVNVGKDVVVQPKPAFGNATDGTGEPIPAATLDAVRKVDGVAAAEGSLTGFGQLLDKDGKLASTGFGAPTIVTNPFTDADLNTTTYQEGTPPDAAGEMALDKGTAERLKVGLGDRLGLATPNGNVDLTVTGVFSFGSSNSLAGATLVEMPTEQVQQLFDRVGLYDEIDVRGHDGLTQEELRDRVATVLPATAQADTAEQAAADQAESVGEFVGFLRIGLTGFAFVALFVGSFIIVNTFSILVTQRTRELGLLRALGASRRQVLASILGESVGVGVIGSLVGIAGGIVLAFLLSSILQTVLGGGTSSLVVKPMSMLIPFALGTAITVAAALYPGIRGSRVPPLAAMRETDGSGDGGLGRRAVAGGVTTAAGAGLFGLGLSNGVPLLVGLGALVLFIGLALLLAVAARPLSGAIGLPFARLGTASRLGVANARRNPRRTASTASALMIGLALIGGVSTFAASVSASVTDLIDRSVRADLVVQRKGFSEGFGTELTDQIAALPSADRSTPIRGGEIRLDGSSRSLTALDPADTDLIALDVKQGSASAIANGEVLVDETLAKDKGWQVGQLVDLVYARTGPSQARLGGTFAKNQLAGDAVASLDTFSRNFTSDLDTVALVTAKPGQLDSLRQQVTAVTDANPTVKVQTRAEFQAEQRQAIDQVVQIVYVLLALSVAIAVIGIVNTLALSVFERTRELSLLRAVGMHRKQVKRMVRTESVVVSTMGGIVGLAVGVLLGAAFVRSLADQGIDRLGLPVGQLLAGLVFTGLAGLLAALYPAAKASKMDVLRAITVE